MSLSDFSKNFDYETNENKQKEFVNLDQSDKDLLKNRYNELKNKSHDELTDELYKEVERQKENGTFDFDTLRKSVNAISSFISPEQLENINQLLDNIK